MRCRFLIRGDLGSVEHGGCMYVAIEHDYEPEPGEGDFYTAIHLPDVKWQPEIQGWVKTENLELL
jgi:hypothetical protein